MCASQNYKEDRECTKEEIKKEREVLRSRNIHIYIYIKYIYSMFLTTHIYYPLLSQALETSHIIHFILTRNP